MPDPVRATPSVQVPRPTRATPSAQVPRPVRTTPSVQVPRPTRAVRSALVPRPTRAVRSALVAVALLAALGGCGMGTRTASDPFGAVGSAGDTGRPGPRTARLEVSVQNRTSATIHVTARGGRRTEPLGDVAAMDAGAFQARWTRRTDLTFLVRVDGAVVCASRAIEAEPGRAVVLTVDPAPADVPGGTPAQLACAAVVVS